LDDELYAAEALPRGSAQLLPSLSVRVVSYDSGPCSDILANILGVNMSLFFCNSLLLSTFFTFTYV
jgi:hypothetical protein